MKIELPRSQKWYVNWRWEKNAEKKPRINIWKWQHDIKHQQSRKLKNVPSCIPSFYIGFYLVQVTKHFWTCLPKTHTKNIRHKKNKLKNWNIINWSGPLFSAFARKIIGKGEKIAILSSIAWYNFCLKWLPPLKTNMTVENPHVQ